MKKKVLTAVLLMALAAALMAQTPNSPNDFEIANSALGGVQITKYIGNRSNVVIPSTIDGMRVTELGRYSFSPYVASSKPGVDYEPTGIVAITSVVFPNTLIAIGEGAFLAQQLTSVSFPNSLRTIKRFAFGNNKLTSVVVPNGVTLLGDSSFGGNLITTVVIPPSLANFKGSIGLLNFFMDTTSEGFAFAFPEQGITRFTLPDNVHKGNFQHGDNVNIGEFYPDLEAAYQGNGRRAGTYTWTGRIWSTAADAKPGLPPEVLAAAERERIAAAEAAEIARTAAEEKARKDAIPFNTNGEAAAARGDSDRAIADFTRAIQLDPNFASAYSNRGLEYYKKRDWDRAIADYTQAIRLDQKSATSYNNRGAAYNNKSDWDRAIADFNEAIRIDPNYAAPYRHRAFAYMQKGNYTQARADVDKALQINRNYQNAQELSAELQRRGY